MHTTSATTPQSAPSTTALPEQNGAGESWLAEARESLDTLVAVLARPGHGVVMTAGGAGVGKSTMAAAIAVLLARRGCAVRLVLTDASGELARSLVGKVDGLTLVNIDSAAETAAYCAEVVRVRGGALNQAGRAMLEEDLQARSTAELAMFRAFAREAVGDTTGFVVLDAAPTAHTLLLLDASATYQRELERQEQSEQPEEVRQLLARLRDPAFARVVMVAPPGKALANEAVARQEDLRRAHIDLFAWILNQARPVNEPGDATSPIPAANAHRAFCNLADANTPRTAWVPLQPEAPLGAAALARLGAARVKSDAT